MSGKSGRPLLAAVDERKTIGMALGILMERYRIGEAQASTMLVRTSETSDADLEHVAARIVDDHDTKARRHRPRTSEP